MSILIGWGGRGGWWGEGGGAEEKFQDCLKELLKELDINPSTWESLAQDHTQLGVAKSPLRLVRQKTDGPQMRRGNAPYAKPTSLHLYYSFHTLMSHVWESLLGLDWPHKPSSDPSPLAFSLKQYRIQTFGLKIRGEGGGRGPFPWIRHREVKVIFVFFEGRTTAITYRAVF